MITIQGQRLETTTLETLTEDAVAKQILAVMEASSGAYAYDNRLQLKFELELRCAVVKAARALNDSKFSFEDFHDARCNGAYWKRTENGGFQLKDGALPGVAISDIYENGGLYATECATAMQIVYYKALLDVYGEETFNRVFPRIYLMNWDIYDPLLAGLGMPVRETDILIGDRGYFANEDVDPKTPEWRGENVIILPDSLYYGHGLGICTADEIITALNARRVRGAERSAHFLDRVSRPNFKRLAAAQNATPTPTPTEVPPPTPTGPLIWRFPA